MRVMKPSGQDWKLETCLEIGQILTLRTRVIYAGVIAADMIL